MIQAEQRFGNGRSGGDNAGARDDPSRLTRRPRARSRHGSRRAAPRGCGPRVADDPFQTGWLTSHRPNEGRTPWPIRAASSLSRACAPSIRARSGCASWTSARKAVRCADGGARVHVGVFVALAAIVRSAPEVSWASSHAARAGPRRPTRTRRRRPCRRFLRAGGATRRPRRGRRAGVTCHGCVVAVRDVIARRSADHAQRGAPRY